MSAPCEESREDAGVHRQIVLGDGSDDDHGPHCHRGRPASRLRGNRALRERLHGGKPLHPIWSKNLWQEVDYATRLGQVRAPTLICAGRFDPQTPLPCSEELKEGIPAARMILFEKSGHSPFIEERDFFMQTVEAFLN